MIKSYGLLPGMIGISYFKWLPAEFGINLPYSQIMWLLGRFANGIFFTIIFDGLAHWFVEFYSDGNM
jgi:hypothetical protein